MTPDTDAQPGEVSPADGPGPRELLRYRSAQGRWVVAAMILGSSVAGIDSTVVVVALPAIGRNLHVGFQALQWTVTGYTLPLASLILLAGSLSDRWGRRRVFLVGLGWFTAASVLCAAAPGIGWLIAARAVQGIGGALMTPASLAIIEATLQPADRTRAIGTWAGFSGVPVQLRPDQLDLRGSVRLRRAALCNLYHRAAPPHPGTTAGAHSNPGAPPRLPSRLRHTLT